ncbi:hypothetical protein HMSSN036_81780 [Paenibacillus macerans]|nr:hypothetical protein HMSSN036_81780 [Paenibacillus macerans]
MHKKLRLRNRADFNRIYRFGKSFANRQLVVYWSNKPDIERFRLGVSASKKIGNAVVRNRMRRLLKEIVRLHEAEIRDHVDLILIVRSAPSGWNTRNWRKACSMCFGKPRCCGPPDVRQACFFVLLNML